MELDIDNLRRELDAIEEQYKIRSKVAQLEAAVAAERALVQDLEAQLAGVRAALRLPPAGEEEEEEEESSSSSSSSTDEDRLTVRGPKKQKKNLERPFVCGQCDSDFSARQYLVRHQNLTGHGGSPYSCPGCGEGFTTGILLARHRTKEEH
jgi:hypothetical protein